MAKSTMGLSSNHNMTGNVAKPHEQHISAANAFGSTEKSLQAAQPKTTLGGGSKPVAYGFAKSGMPRTPAQEQSVKKAAEVSATNRGMRAGKGLGSGSNNTMSLGYNVGKPKKGLLGA